jgi:hypothetical protein
VDLRSDRRFVMWRTGVLLGSPRQDAGPGVFVTLFHDDRLIVGAGIGDPARRYAAVVSLSPRHR